MFVCPNKRTVYVVNVYTVCMEVNVWTNLFLPQDDDIKPCWVYASRGL